MALLPHALDFRGFFLWIFSFLSFKTGGFFPKVVSREKSFSNFFCLGGSKSSSFFAYHQRENNTASLTNLENWINHAWPATRAQAVTEDTTSGGVVGRPASHAENAKHLSIWYEKEAIHHRFGCSYHRTTYTRSIENWRWRVKHRLITTRAAHLRSQSHRWKLHRMQYSDVSGCRCAQKVFVQKPCRTRVLSSWCREGNSYILLSEKWKIDRSI